MVLFHTDLTNCTVIAGNRLDQLIWFFQGITHLHTIRVQLAHVEKHRPEKGSLGKKIKIGSDD